MPYQIAIPSYRRAQTLVGKTLKWLQRTNVPWGCIKVFVADAEQQAEYQMVLQSAGIPPPELVVAEPGMGAVRRFIHTHYPPGTRLVNMDDDLTGLDVKVNDKTRVPVPNVDAFFEEAFDLTERGNMRLWGVYPVKNPMFMKHEVTTTLRYICGGLYGTIQTDRPDEPGLLVTLDDKEDFERSILYYLADGGVLRFNHICLLTTGYAGDGGMQVERTDRRIRESAEYLAAKYPELATLNLTKKSGKAELRLKDRRKRI